MKLKYTKEALALATSLEHLEQVSLPKYRGGPRPTIRLILRNEHDFEVCLSSDDSLANEVIGQTIADLKTRIMARLQQIGVEL